MRGRRDGQGPCTLPHTLPFLPTRTPATCTRACTHALTHSFTHTHSLTHIHSHTLPLTHLLTHTYAQADPQIPVPDARTVADYGATVEPVLQACAPKRYSELDPVNSAYFRRVRWEAVVFTVCIIHTTSYV